MSFCPGIVAVNDTGQGSGHVSFVVVTQNLFHRLGEAEVTTTCIRGEDQNFGLASLYYRCSMMGGFIVNFHKITSLSLCEGERSLLPDLPARETGARFLLLHGSSLE